MELKVTIGQKGFVQCKANLKTTHKVQQIQKERHTKTKAEFPHTEVREAGGDCNAWSVTATTSLSYGKTLVKYTL